MTKPGSRLLEVWTLGAAALIGGCAAPAPVQVRAFDRAAYEDVRLGTTSAQAVVAKYGKPASDLIVKTPIQPLRLLLYSQDTNLPAKPAKEGVVPARRMRYFFADNVLVGHYFESNLTGETTDFDYNAAKALTKGLTADDVVSRLGRPAGRVIYPMVKREAAYGIVYAYWEVRRGVAEGAGLQFYKKHFVASFDANGTVIEVDPRQDLTECTLALGCY